MERTPLGRLAQIYRTFTKNYRDLDKEAAAESEMTDGAPIYHSDQEQLDKDWDCKFSCLFDHSEGMGFLWLPFNLGWEMKAPSLFLLFI
ncbi:hypothetical protein BgiMline_022184 [Biomphalaria glabrata]|nr:hypothetical protein BgiMline_010065 [Biomphalaria glabrata]